MGVAFVGGVVAVLGGAVLGPGGAPGSGAGVAAQLCSANNEPTPTRTTTAAITAAGARFDEVLELMTSRYHARR